MGRRLRLGAHGGVVCGVGLVMQAQLFIPAKPAQAALRDYQEECVASIFESLKTNRSTMVVMATGLGKSVIVSALARMWPGRAMVIAHREELIAQMAAHLERDTGLQVDYEQRDRFARASRVVVASIQTLTRGDRYKRFQPNEFSLVVVDEFHHYAARTFRKPLEYFTGAKLLGVTATPDRGDEKALGAIVDDVAYSMDIEDGITQGWLVPIKARVVELDKVNLDRVGVSRGDLKQGELDDEMAKGVEGVVAETLKYEPDRKAIGFFPGIVSAELACEAFNAKQPGSSCFVSGKTDPDERRRLDAAFKAGDYLRLLNCQIATEGYDCPDVSLIIQARPTKSRALYTQMVGRGTRPIAGIVDVQQGWSHEQRVSAIRNSGKPNCVVLDFVGNATKHSLISAVDALGGNYTEDEVKEAKARAKKAPGETTDYLTALQEARKELKRKAAAMRNTFTSKVYEVDPFRFAGSSAERLGALDARYGAAPATPGQREFLLRRGFSDQQLTGMSRRAASSLLESMLRRQKAGAASMKQLRLLAKFSAVSPETSFTTAKTAIDYIVSMDWGRSQDYNKQRLQEILGD